MYFVEGQFEEVVYGIEKSKLAVKKRKAASDGTLTYMADFMGVHSLQNIGDQRAFSLHLYAKPIVSCHIFDPHSEQFTTKNLIYDTQVSLEQ
jgi:cysteine dioxygenase